MLLTVLSGLLYWSQDEHEGHESVTDADRYAGRYAIAGISAARGALFPGRGQFAGAGVSGGWGCAAISGAG
jgi:hypothetical protein